MRTIRHPVGYLAAMILGLAPAGAQPEAPALRALAITADQAITLDGVLDEAVWSRAELGGGFTQRQPNEYEPATEQTTVRVLYTPETLYIGIHAMDSEPARVIGKEMGRDVSIWRDDGLVVLLDTFHDRRNAYFLETNPSSSRTDGLVTDEGRDFSIDWDGVWDVRSRRTHDGWVAEFAIPFRSLRFDPKTTTWGLQVRRIIKRKNEITFWAPIGRDAGIFRLSKAGTLTGLEGLRTGRNLRIKPYVSTAFRQLEGEPDDDQTDELGLDVKWGVTQGLSLDLTVNTDFAETEVDEQQVNLTRFSLFFPEKREFFLENAGIFEFGPDLGSLLKIFFSRRIGLDEGRRVELELGARLAGRAGPWSIGVLGVRTGSLDADPVNELGPVSETDWGTLRLKRNVGERSNVGLIATHKSDGMAENQVYGLDGEWKPTDRHALWAFGAVSRIAGDGESSDGWAGGVGADYSATDWEASARVFEVDDSFDPQLGFVLRPGRRNLAAELEWRPRPEWRGVRNLAFELETDHWSRDGRTETSVVSADFFGVDFLSGESARAWVTLIEERLFDSFEIFRDVVLSPGSYAWHEVGVWAETNAGRPLSFSGWIETGELFDGDRLAHSLRVSWRPSRFFRTELSWRRNDIDLPEGAFETNLWSQRISFSASPDLTFDALLQYSDAAEEVSANLRFNWHYRPGSDVFIVYNHGWDAPSFRDLLDRDRQVVVKLTYSWDA